VLEYSFEGVFQSKEGDRGLGWSIGRLVVLQEECPDEVQRYTASG
jgi:hypothetical protein